MPTFVAKGDAVLASHINAKRDKDTSIVEADLESGLAARVRGGAFRLVATSSSPAWARSAATYLGDGIADQVEIQSALDEQPTTGGRVLLAPGTYNLTAPVRVEKHATSFHGSGTGHRSSATQDSDGTKLQVSAGFTGAAAVVVAAPSGTQPLHGVSLQDFTIDGADVVGPIDGVLWRSHTGAVDHVHIHRMSGRGIALRGYSIANDGAASDWATYDSVLSRLIISYNALAGVDFDIMGQDCHIFGSVIFNNQDNIRIRAGSQQITACHTYDAARYNVFFDGSGTRTKIVNLKCEQAANHGIFLDGTTAGTSDVMILGSNFKNNGHATTNTWDHIHIGGTNAHARTTIVGCNFTQTATYPNLPRYGVNGASSATQNLVLVGNNFGAAANFGTTALNLASSATVTAAGNQLPNGKTRNTGTASIANGNTITHGLAKTPTAYTVTPTVAGRIAAVTAVGGTTLTVSLLNHDGTAVTTAENVAWVAEV